MGIKLSQKEIETFKGIPKSMKCHLKTRAKATKGSRQNSACGEPSKALFRKAELKKHVNAFHEGKHGTQRNEKFALWPDGNGWQKLQRLNLDKSLSVKTKIGAAGQYLHNSGQR